MTKNEAKKMLYDFLRRKGLATRYFYNCIYHNNYYRDKRANLIKSLSPKDKLKKIIDCHLDDFIKSNTYNGAKAINMDGFFNDSQHSFTWDKSEEGYTFWEKVYFDWEKNVLNKLPKDERILTVRE
jgi:hypothetical protein